MHFYIPPEIKLLAEVHGTVPAMERGSAQYPEGMLIRFRDFSRETMKVPEGSIEGKRRLIDRKAQVILMLSSHSGLDPESSSFSMRGWIPAFAGMTSAIGGTAVGQEYR